METQNYKQQQFSLIHEEIVMMRPDRTNGSTESIYFCSNRARERKRNKQFNTMLPIICLVTQKFSSRSEAGCVVARSMATNNMNEK
jgi:hypothetical protein